MSDAQRVEVPAIPLCGDLILQIHQTASLTGTTCRGLKGVSPREQMKEPLPSERTFQQTDLRTLLLVSVSCSSFHLTARRHWLNLYVCAGQSIDGETSFYISKTDKGNQPGSLSRPQANSILVQTIYHCSCGLQGFSRLLPHALTQLQLWSSRL